MCTKNKKEPTTQIVAQTFTASNPEKLDDEVGRWFIKVTDGYRIINISTYGYYASGLGGNNHVKSVTLVLEEIS